MKNVKLTLATTLSVLAMAFSGLASAETLNDYSNYKQNYKLKNVTKSVKTKVVNRNALKRSVLNRNTLSDAQKNKLAKRVVVKKAPKRSVVLTKRIVKKPATTKYVSNKRFNQTKKVDQRVTSKNRYKSNKQYQRYDRVNAKRVVKQAVYSVRSGDTLIQVAFKTGVSVSRLAKLNRISHANLNHLKIGQVLRLV